MAFGSKSRIDAIDAEKGVHVATTTEKDVTTSETSSEDIAVVSVDPDHTRRVTRKCDLHLLPPFIALYFLTFIDRVNLGNTRIQGLEKDLQMNPKGNDFNIALVVFFVPFVLFEMPSNILLKHVRPSLLLSLEVFFLAIATIGQGVITNYHGLVAMRFLVGLGEAGLVPGSVYLLSHYYPRFELQWRLSLLFIANALASAFGGLLAYAIAGLSSSSPTGYHGWRWIFIIEGSVTAVASLICIVIMPDWPDTASFLTPKDRVLIKTRIANDGGIAKMDHFDSRAIRRCLKDWKIWLSIAIYICTCNTLYAINLFSPTIIALLNPTFTPRAAQARVIPIFVVSALAAALVAYFSDRTRHRYAFAMAGYLVGAIGWIVLVNESHVGITIRYVALYFVSVGGYVTLPLLWTLLVNNCGGTYKTAFAAGMQIGWGNSAGVVASLIFESKEAPGYKTGYRTSLGLFVAGAVLLTGFLGALWRENRRRERGERDYRLAEEDAANLGDDHPRFRFVF